MSVFCVAIIQHSAQCLERSRYLILIYEMDELFPPPRYQEAYISLSFLLPLTLSRNFYIYPSTLYMLKDEFRRTSKVFYMIGAEKCLENLPMSRNKGQNKSWTVNPNKDTVWKKTYQYLLSSLTQLLVGHSPGQELYYSADIRHHLWNRPFSLQALFMVCVPYMMGKEFQVALWLQSEAQPSLKGA